MGTELFCDLCRGSVAVASGLTPILFGEEQVGEACLSCASQVKTSLKQQMAQTAANMNAARNVDPNAPPDPAAAEPPKDGATNS